MITVSSGRTTTQALISAPAASAVCASAPGRLNPTVRPPPIAADCFRNSLREGANVVVMIASSRFHRFRRGVDRRANARVGSAAADIGHHGVDVLVAGVAILAEKSDRRHDLPGLAVAALRHFVVDPRLLHRVQAAEPGTEQERTGSPFRCTVQAPHWAMPQPNLGPFTSSTSRNTHKRGISGSTSTPCFLPLTVNSIIWDLLGCTGTAVCRSLKYSVPRSLPHYPRAPCGAVRFMQFILRFEPSGRNFRA